MAEPLRSDDPGQNANLADREARIEQLLLSGLDHYFAAQYEQAIHVWTRVVFLDRTHDRARAYIERARRAIAERQRESEELVQRGIDAFNQGQPETSRRLLNDAIARGGANEAALTFLDRLNRLEAGSGASVPLVLEPAAPRVPPPTPQPPAPRSGRGRRWIAVVAALCALVVGALFLWQGPQADGGAEIAATVPPGIAIEPLPVPRSAEILLVRARTLYDNGRLLDALRVLDGVPPADILRADADRLRGDIQRDLLAVAVPAAPTVDSMRAPASGAPPTR